MFSLKRSVQGPAKAAMIYYGKLDKNFKVEKYHSVSHRSLSEKEREIILSDLSDNLVLKNLVIAFLETGVRRSEIQELVKNYKDISNVVEIIGKGNKKRTIPLNKSAIKAIGYLKNQKFDINSQATNL
jgi:site-specific recombinase XerD